MKKLLSIIIYSSLLMLSNVITAQSISGIALNIPAKYNNPNENTSLEITSERNKNQIWIVYSDRDGNISYIDSTSKLVHKSFNLMSKFYVIEESQNRVHIIKDKDYLGEYGFSTLAVDFGWVLKERLLLWNNSLYNHQVLSEEKCFIVNNNETSENIETGTFYFDPYLQRGMSKTINSFSLFYIYKMTDNAVLVGLKPGINAYGQLMIIGWVPKAKILRWNDRTAIEPNFDSAAIFERRQNNIKTTFCNNKAGARRLAQGKFINSDSIIWDNDPYEMKWSMNRMRFPLIDYNSEDGVIETIVYYTKKNSELNVTTSNAFAPLMVEGLSNPLFHKVIYLTKAEVESFVFINNSYKSITNTSNTRSDIKWFLIGLLENKYGESYTPEEFEDYSFRDFNKVFYYMAAPRKMQSLRLSDLTDPSIISDEHFSSYYDRLKDQIRLTEIIVEYIKSEIGLQFHDYDFFWIPEKLLK